MKYVVKNARILTAEGWKPGDVWVADGKFTGVTMPPMDMDTYTEVVDAGGLIMMPGGIDVHTHLDMPFGGTVSADDYVTGTQAAAVGGTTTLIDFALQNQKSTLKDALETWLKKSEGKACIDFSLHMAVTNLHGPGGKETLDEMEEMTKAGISSFKLFMAYPNVLMINDELMFRVMQKAAALNALCLIHAENGSVIDVVIEQALKEGKTEPHWHAIVRSPEAEAEATHRAIAIAKMAGAAVYIVHLSNEFALNELKHMQAQGAKALAETCTQYLELSREQCMPGHEWGEARYVFTPPLRDARHIWPLWQALRDGTLSVVSTDHCPFTMEQKALGRHDFTKIPNGGPGVENRMQVVWTRGVRGGIISPEKFVEVCCTNPAKIFGMEGQKGKIEPGYDADFVFWDPDAEYTISAETQVMANDYNLYEGMRIVGNAAKVYSRGELVVDNVAQPGKFLGKTGRGKFIKRECNAGGFAG